MPRKKKADNRRSNSKIDYREYIRSPEWRKKHSKWLKASDYRCAFFPWVRVGKPFKGRFSKRKYRGYNCHHMHYRNLGREKLNRDVVVLSPFVHQFIIHGILSGWRKPSQQQHYPNAFQRIAHGWCVLPYRLKQAIGLFVLFVLAAATAILISDRYFGINVGKTLWNWVQLLWG
jgi:hypothetical protein